MKYWLVSLIPCLFSTLGFTQTLYFPPTNSLNWDTAAPQQLGWCTERVDSLYRFLDANNTKAFIVLQDGKIVLERYFGGHTQFSPWQWASAGKTLTALLVGIAQEEGLLSIHDTTATYLGNAWTDCSITEEEQITLWHQLTMTTGFDDGVPDPNCLQPNCLQCLATPGARWAYHNPPYTLLDNVIAAATGQSMNDYLTTKLKSPTGMTGSFVSIGANNVFFSNARSMARFGLLILNEGYWGSTAILSDSNYFQQMTSPSQSINLSYGYLWWLNGQSSFRLPGSQFNFPGMINPNAPSDALLALGKDGQFLNVVPSQNRVVLRMGNASNNQLVPFLLNDEIWEHINWLDCQTTQITEASEVEIRVKLFPNPTNTTAYFESSKPLNNITLTTTEGQILFRNPKPNKHGELPTMGLPPGVYFVSFEFLDGVRMQRKLVVSPQ